MAAMVMITSRGNSNKSQSEQTEQAAPSALSIDDLLSDADSLVNKEVTIEGFVHTPASMALRKCFDGQRRY